MKTDGHRNGFGRAMIWKLAIAALLCACNMSAVNPPTAPAPIAATSAVHAERGAKSTYEVGVGFALKTPNDVPWESLKAGDTVLIHWRPEAYKSKWVICAAGTEQAPITIRGVPGPKGQLPVIDGEDATTRKQISYWGENRSIVKIGGAKIPDGLGSKWIVIENLEIANGHPPMGYTSCKGEVAQYARNAAAIWVENCEHLVVRNCILHNCGNGFVTSSNDGRASEDILVEGCHIYDNGNV